MRANVSETRDHLNRERLPEDLTLALDFPERAEDERPRHFLAASHLIAASTFALLITLGLRLVSYVIQGGFYLALLTFLCFVIALWSYLSFPGRIWRTLRAGIILLAGPAFWVLVTLAGATGHAPFALALALPLSLVALLFLADRIATHAVCHGATALPRQSPERAAFLADWVARFPRKHKPDEEPFSSEEPTFRRYVLRFLILLPLLGLSYIVYLVAHHLQRQLFSGMLAVLTLVIATFVVSLLVGRTSSSDQPPSLSRTWRALSSWTTYNRFDLKLLGIFQSPSGSAKSRTLSTQALLLVLALVILPASSYFALVPQSVGLGAWYKAYNEGALPAIVNFFDGEPEVVLMPKALTREDLTPRERARYDAQRTDEGRRLVLEIAASSRAQNKRGPAITDRRAARKAMARTPESWLLLTLNGATTGRGVFLWALFVAAALSILVPPLFLLSVLHLVAGPAISLAATAKPARPIAPRAAPERPPTPSPSVLPVRLPYPPGGIPAWDSVVNHFQTSGHSAGGIKLRDHLFFGTRYPYGDVVAVDRAIIHEHCFAMGGSGTGKTGRFLAPTIAQLIRLSRTLPVNEKNHSVFIFDLKGDAALRRGAELEAEKAGVPFKWFSIEPETTSYVFNPFAQSFVKDTGINHLTSTALKALGLDFGHGYGTLHFSLVYQRVFGHLVESSWGPKGPTFGSFKEAKERLEATDRTSRRKVTAEDEKQASDLYTLIDELARVPQLNVTHKDDPDLAANAIDFYEALCSPQVIYFHLPEREGTVIGRIATFAAFTLLDAAAVYLRRHGGQEPRVYFFIDEFQNIAADHFAIFVTQARSAGIATIMANQVGAQLSTQKDTLLPIIQESTRLQVFYSAISKQMRDYIIEASGEALYDIGPSVTQDLLDGDVSQTRPGPLRSVVEGLAESLGLREEELSRALMDDLHGYDPTLPKQIGPAIRPNDLIDMTDAPERAVLYPTRSSGFTQYGGRPIFVQSPFHITPEEYDRRKAAPWPERAGETMSVEAHGAIPTSKTSPSLKPPPTQADSHELDEWGRELTKRGQFTEDKNENERRPRS